MKINEFKLEKYLERYELATKLVLCASDCESFEVEELLSDQELLELGKLRLGYSQAQGSQPLREEIAKLFESVLAKEIVICVPQEGIFVLMNALLDAKDKVIVQVPCYQSLCEVPAAIGCQVTKWVPSLSGDEWYWDVDFLRENVDEDTRLVVVNSPHNPTGHHFSRTEFEEIIEVAAEKGCFVFSDEMYRMLEYSDRERLPSGSDIYEKCASLSGLSKTFGLGGLRVGWLSIKDKNLRKKVMQLKDYTTLSNSTVSQFIALASLKRMDHIVSRNLKIIKRNLRLLNSFFVRHKDKFGWFKPKAGSVAFVKKKFEGEIEEFCEDLVKQKGVLLMPGTKFDYEGFFRIGFGRKNMPRALKLFEEYLEEYC